MPDDFDYSQPRKNNSVIVPSERTLRPPIITYAIVVICVLVFAARAFPDLGLPLSAVQFGRADAQDIWNGAYGTLVTSAFAHGSYMHIGMNMLALLQIGAVLEGTINPLAYIGFIVLAAITGSGAQLAFDGETGVGFSGVLYAMLGLLWAGRHRMPSWGLIANPDNARYAVGWALFCIVATEMGFMSIANWAHGAGLVFGLAVGYVTFGPRRALWSIPLAALVAISIMACTWVPWSEGWNAMRADQEYNSHHYEAAIKYYKRAIDLGADPAPCWYIIGKAWYNIARKRLDAKDTEGAAEAIRRGNAAIKSGGPEAKSMLD
ncbi:MAG TPA: rhomboid family intramembrane serine protease [Capsulimonadaceae bacterium]|jgi:GlpG protein